MKNLNRFFAKPSIITLASVMLLAIGILVWGHKVHGSQMPINAGSIQINGVPDDWTHRHVVFSDPGAESDAFRDGVHDTWLKIVNDPRYIMQQLKHHLPAQGPAAANVDWIERMARTNAPTEVLTTAGAEEAQLSVAGAAHPAKSKTKKITKDWNETLGSATAPSYPVYPAKWSFNTTGASCADDFVIYPTGQAGSISHASIIAYYNLYTTGCAGPVPEVDWAYNTGGTASLAPVFSLNGSQVAFIQTSGSVASLVLLTYPFTPPGAGTLTTPIAPMSKTPATYPGCTAPCMTSIALNGSHNDLTSNPYYDYGTDSLYVGDSSGALHKFHPVFNGTAGTPFAEVTISGWPLTLNAANSPTSPLYDGTSGCVFVGDTGGILYSVNSGNPGAVCTSTTASKHGTSSQLDVTYGIRDAPLVDSTAAKVYVFAGNDPSGNNGVFQFPTSFTTGSGTEVTVGGGGTGTTAYQLDGTFDNTYYTSSNSSTPSGDLYVCGTGAPATLYQIAISSGVMGTVTTGPTLADSGYYGRCSPVTEFFNTSSPTSATGTVTLTTNPSTWGTGKTVTVGSATYTFVSSLTAVNQVLLVTTNGTNANETDTAENLEAVINNTSSQCNGGSGCIFTGQTANASVTATQAAHVVTLTAKKTGAGGNFTLSTNYPTGMTVSGGNNGSNGTDYLFLSVLIGTQSGCTDAATDGCVMSFNVTTPSNFSSSLTPRGTLNISAAGLSAPTGGLIIDNALTSPAGTSQIYFHTLDTAGTSPCTGICAVQASQATP
jgi:hypothetical protein